MLQNSSDVSAISINTQLQKNWFPLLSHLFTEWGHVGQTSRIWIKTVKGRLLTLSLMNATLDGKRLYVGDETKLWAGSQPPWKSVKRLEVFHVLTAWNVLFPPGEGNPDSPGFADVCQHEDWESLWRPEEAPCHCFGAGEQPSCHVLWWTNQWLG